MTPPLPISDYLRILDPSWLLDLQGILNFLEAHDIIGAQPTNQKRVRRALEKIFVQDLPRARDGWVTRDDQKFPGWRAWRWQGHVSREDAWRIRLDSYRLFWRRALPVVKWSLRDAIDIYDLGKEPMPMRLCRFSLIAQRLGHDPTSKQYPQGWLEYGTPIPWVGTPPLAALNAAAPYAIQEVYKICYPHLDPLQARATLWAKVCAAQFPLHGDALEAGVPKWLGARWHRLIKGSNNGTSL